NRQRRRTHDRIAAIQPYALIAIATYGSCPARTVAKVLRQAVGIGPNLANLSAHSQYIAPPYGPPLLQAQAAAIKGLALVQGNAGPQAEVHQVAFPGII